MGNIQVNFEWEERDIQNLDQMISFSGKQEALIIN